MVGWRSNHARITSGSVGLRPTECSAVAVGASITSWRRNTSVTWRISNRTSFQSKAIWENSRSGWPVTRRADSVSVGVSIHGVVMRLFTRRTASIRSTCRFTAGASSGCRSPRAFSSSTSRGSTREPADGGPDT